MQLVDQVCIFAAEDDLLTPASPLYRARVSNTLQHSLLPQVLAIVGYLRQSSENRSTECAAVFARDNMLAGKAISGKVVQSHGAPAASRAVKVCDVSTYGYNPVRHASTRHACSFPCFSCCSNEGSSQLCAVLSAIPSILASALPSDQITI